MKKNDHPHARFSFSVDIVDNKTKNEYLFGGFSTDMPWVIIHELENAIDAMRSIQKKEQDDEKHP